MQEVNIYELLKYYVRNWLILFSSILAGAIVGLVYTNFIQVPLYQSSATILVVDANTAQDTTINNNYTELFKSRRVLETVIDTQKYNGDYAKLLSRSAASNDKDTDVLRVSIADTSAQKSEELLSASLESFKIEATELYGSDNLKVVDPANLPVKPYNVNAPIQIGLSIVASLFLTIIVLFFIYDYESTQLKPSRNSGQTSAAKKLKKSKASKQPLNTLTRRILSKVRMFLGFFTGPLRKK